MSTLTYILYFLAGFNLIATIVPFIPSDKWYVRGFEFTHAQICFLTIITLAGWVLYLPLDSFNLILGIFLFGSFLYQFVVIFPYTPLARKQVLSCTGTGTRFSLLSCNIFMNNKQVEKCLSLIDQNDPDLVLLVETNHWWLQQIKHLENKYPFRVSLPLENTYGMILFSKMQLHGSEIKFLVESDVPSIHTTVVIDSKNSLRLFCLHPAPPSPTENESAIERDAELLIVAKMIDPKREPVIVIGDLNDVAWSPTTRLFQKVSGLLDPRVGRGFFNTFHVSFPFLRWPLDHIFHSSHFKLSRIKRGPDIGSDHFPIFVELCYDKNGPIEQEEPVADKEDLQIANEKIDQVV